MAFRVMSIWGLAGVSTAQQFDGRSRPTNYDRVLAQCFADGQDIGEPLVDVGYACDWLRFSGGHYSAGVISKPCSNDETR